MLIGLLLVTALSLPVDSASPAVVSGTTVDSVRYFPRVEGSNLEGRRFLLPADFEAEFNVVIVAFRRKQQADVDSWLSFLAEQKVRERGVRVYELPTLNRSYTIMRRFIDGGMARGIPEKATRAATITLYVEKSRFKKTLAISTEDRIVTMVVARDGRVHWTADGRFTAAFGAELVSALEALKVFCEPETCLAVARTNG
jgi:hypothetical protein